MIISLCVSFSPFQMKMTRKELMIEIPVVHVVQQVKGYTRGVTRPLMRGGVHGCQMTVSHFLNIHIYYYFVFAIQI